MNPITIRGMTGTDADLPRLQMDDHTMDPMWEGNKTYVEVTEFVAIRTRRRVAYTAAKWHNTLTPLLDQVEKTYDNAIRAMNNANIQFGKLSTATTSDWAAAHHRWMLAVDKAKDALEQWRAAEKAAEKVDTPGDDVLALYRAEVPPVQRVTARLQCLQWRDLHDSGATFLDEAAHRCSLTAATLRHLTSIESA